MQLICLDLGQGWPGKAEGLQWDFIPRQLYSAQLWSRYVLGSSNTDELHRRQVMWTPAYLYLGIPVFQKVCSATECWIIILECTSVPFIMCKCSLTNEVFVSDSSLSLNLLLKCVGAVTVHELNMGNSQI